MSSDSDHQRELIERVAQRIERWGLVTPAVLLLESARPLHFIGGQLLYLAQPLLGSAAGRYAELLEHPDSVDQLTARLEQRQTGKTMGTGKSPTEE